LGEEVTGSGRGLTKTKNNSVRMTDVTVDVET
jgi:hypothetical protein